MAKSSAVTGSAARTRAGSGTARTGRSRAAQPAGSREPRESREPRAQAAGTRDEDGDVPAPARKKPAAKRAPRLPKPIAGAVQAALDKKAEDVIVLDLRKTDGFTDFFIICSGGNPRQIAAIAEGVRETLKRDFAERPALAEGIDRSEWILLDYFNFVVHVFSRDCRAFYGLERLWGNAERHEFA